MPIRVYECPFCGYRVERLEWTFDPHLPLCPRCDHTVEMPRLPTAANPQFKGSGFYATDYKPTPKDAKTNE
jgi:putative FmdB family regulatory protein